MIQGTQRQIRTVYRGQHMSASELGQLRKCVGGLIAMTSFASASMSRHVAEIFAGNGEQRPQFESVMFEIILHQSEHQYKRSPFANVSEFSSKPYEEEVLLCLGSTLRVESLVTQGPITSVRLHVCEREVNELPRQILKPFGNLVAEDCIVKEIHSLSQLAVLLFFMGDFQKLEEVVRVVQLKTNSLEHPVLTFFLECSLFWTALLKVDPTDIHYYHKLQKSISETKKLARSALNFQSSNDPVTYLFTPLISLIHDAVEALRPNRNYKKAWNLFMKKLTDQERFYRMDLHPIFNILWKRRIGPLVDILKLNDQLAKPRVKHLSEAYQDQRFPGQNPDRIQWCFHLARAAYRQGHDDRAIKFLHEGLAIRSDTDSHIRLHQLLHMIYCKQKNWLGTIECCRNIINMSQLPPNSTDIVEAYMNCGWVFRELADFSEALLNYTKALELQQQHQPPRHPLTAKVHVQLGILFYLKSDTDAAIQQFQSAIALEYPESTTKAHNWMGHTYKRMRKYTEACAHLIQCLQILQQQPSSDAIELAKVYLCLLEIEHIIGNYEEKVQYLQQALDLADGSQEVHQVVIEGIQSILDVPSPSSSHS